MPPLALGKLLFRTEVIEIAATLGGKLGSRSRTPDILDFIRWRMSGEQLTALICRTLRARNCSEADEPIICEAA